MTATPQKPTSKKILYISLGGAGLLGLTLLGVYLLKPKTKTNANQNPETLDQNQTPDPSPSGQTPAPAAHPVDDPALSDPDAIPSFPLKKGDKGYAVRLLQYALLRAYGLSLLPKYGADGWFGTELAAALKAKGYAQEVGKETYKKITRFAEGEINIHPGKWQNTFLKMVQQGKWEESIALFNQIQSPVFFLYLNEAIQKNKRNPGGKGIFKSIESLATTPEKRTQVVALSKARLTQWNALPAKA